MNIHPSTLGLLAVISFSCYAGFNSAPLQNSIDEVIREEQIDTTGDDTTSNDH